MSNIASIMSEFDDIEHLMYMNTYIEGKYIYDGILSFNNKSKDKGLLFQYKDWIILLKMEERLICNHVNNKMENYGESFKILGKGYKENPEEDDQVIQILLNESKRKPKKT